MKRLFMLLLLTGSLLAGVSSSRAASVSPMGDSQTETVATSDQPFYLYQGERIPLQVREDAVAVAFKPQAKTRGGSQPQYLQLQDVLNSGTRSAINTEVRPLGQRYAIAAVPIGTRGTTSLNARIEQQEFVETSLPILSRPGQSETIILNDELIVSFSPTVTAAQQQAILQRHSLEVRRALPLSSNQFVVRTVGVYGLEALSLANTLAELPEMRSVSPNFIQQVERVPQSPLEARPSNKSEVSTPRRLDVAAAPSSRASVAPQAGLLPFQWHINSIPLLSCSDYLEESLSELVTCLQQGVQGSTTPPDLSRTDMRVQEVWNQGHFGAGTVVAVLDDFIQWDHPALRDSMHQVQHSDRCPNERYGWDFSSVVDQAVQPAVSLANDPNLAKTFCQVGDAETRMDEDELLFLRSLLEQAHLLSDQELLDRSPNTVANKRQRGLSDEAIANELRQALQGQVSYEFHGTSVSSIIAAKSNEPFSMAGVAPQAEILPVRFVGLNLTLSVESYLLGILYAAHRGADVINISYGLSFPTDVDAETIAQVLEENPELVIVASSGNHDSDRSNLPAAFPDVLSIGASNPSGQRASYSGYGLDLDLVAPGGDISESLWHGLIVAGGASAPELWENIPQPKLLSGLSLDQYGRYTLTTGTSFASPAVAAVIALMKGAEAEQQLTRDQITHILKRTANREVISLTEDDLATYREISQSKAVNLEAEAKTFFLGEGLVDAEAAVEAVQRITQSR